MLQDLVDAAHEIFRFRELLKDVVMAAMNTPDFILDKIFPIYEEFYELVSSFDSFTVEEVNQMIDTTLIKYVAQPFFPILGGLYVNAMINKLFQSTDEVEISLEKLINLILENARENASDFGEEDTQNINFSMDFIGYLLPENKKLTIRGTVGDFCGALMDKNSSILLVGKHGKHFGYEKDPSANISCRQ